VSAANSKLVATLGSVTQPLVVTEGVGVTTFAGVPTGRGLTVGVSGQSSDDQPTSAAA
jgi:hypothetical protein